MKSGSATEIFSDVYSDEWQKDFREKEVTLNDFFKPITPADYYRCIFGSTDSSCHLLLKETGKFKTAKNFSRVEQFLADNNEVCLYLQSFKYFKPTYLNIVESYGFVVDLDNVRSSHLKELVFKISNMQYKPNILVSSGNGLHLYYLFSEPFNFEAYTASVSMYEFVKRPETFYVVKNVYNKLADLFEGETISYKVDRTHLSQPIRMFGSTTKNFNIRTVGYHVTDERLSFDDYARVFGVELTSDEMARYIENKLGINKDDETQADLISASELDTGIASEKSEIFQLLDDINTTFLEYYQNNKADVRARWLEYAKKLGDDIRPAATSVWQKRQSAKEADYSNYMKTLFKIMHGATIGYRQKLLLIFCSRAAMYRVPEERMKEDARSIMIYWNEKWPHDIVREKELECAFTGYRKYRYSNETILKQTGVDVKLENKKKSELAKKKAIKDEKRSRMRQCATEYIHANRNCSYGKIAAHLALSGFNVSESTIKRDDVIKTAKENG